MQVRTTLKVRIGTPFANKIGWNSSWRDFEGFLTMAWLLAGLQKDDASPKHKRGVYPQNFYETLKEHRGNEKCKNIRQQVFAGGYPPNY